MSNTRKSNGNGPLRQERYASSQEFERGLVANLVAKRCTVLDRAEDRDLVWFLQLLSHEDGGLKRVADELCARFPEQIATSAMQSFGTSPGQIYNAIQVRQVRAEIPEGETDFILKGETDLAAFVSVPDEPTDAIERYAGTWKQHRDAAISEIESKAAKHPASYAAGEFIARCRSAAEQNLERHIGELCLDPAAALVDGSPWYFPNLVSTLREFQSAWVNERQANVVVTAVGLQVYEALDYARESQRMVMIEGDSRMGKTYAVKAWCAMNPGRARYVQVPSTSDDLGFFRAIAKGLGMSCGQSWKAVQLRSRIEEVLQTGQLTVVFDEAHYALPTSSCRTTIPGRINWMMTALVNQGVAVAMVTTPQFMRRQKEIEQRTGWTSEQFTGRIGHYERLPDTLTIADLESVAKALLPSGDSEAIRRLVLYAQSSEKYLAAIESTVARAKYISSRAGRTHATIVEVKQAIKESVIPSDSALAAALEPVKKERRKQLSAQPLQPRFTEPETTMQPAATKREASLGIGRNRIADLDTVPS